MIVHFSISIFCKRQMYAAMYKVQCSHVMYDHWLPQLHTRAKQNTEQRYAGLLEFVLSMKIDKLMFVRIVTDCDDLYRLKDVINVIN
jgi:hypothetical protein